MVNAREQAVIRSRFLSLGTARAAIPVNRVLNNRQNSTGSYESTRRSAQLDIKRHTSYYWVNEYIQRKLSNNESRLD